ncbi:hypothetical protein [Neptuniibacter sp. QD37_11]|uniref:hypothetical protein n=1 Tax=Neptuniibacter sp. QD37_11 TaxID=3398209 RepID=UPI0039F5B736
MSSVLPANIAEHLNECIVSGKSVKLPSYQIDATVFPQVKRAIQGIGGDWNSSSQAFLFDSDPSDLLKRIQAGESIQLERSFKKRTQFFHTPKAVFERMEEWVYPTHGMRVLEPEAGQGHLCDYWKDFASQVSYQDSMTLDVCEMEPEFQSLLEGKGYNVIGSDFMAMSPPENEEDRYNLILANPPFSKNQDVIHVDHMYKFLKKSGMIVAIMSRNWKTASDGLAKEFREWAECGYLIHEEDIPAGMFRESGTGIQTSLVVIQRPPWE